jgi:hypothetical protein
MTGKLVLGTLGAIAGALAGAIAWAAITAATSFQIGYMAVGVGFLAGYGMRVLGGGRDRADGIVAGIVSFLGCVVGNVLAVVMTVAKHQHMSTAETVAASIAVLTHPVLAYRLLTVSFNIMDLLFYAIAIYAGYRTAMKPHVTEVAAQPAVQADAHAAVPAEAEAKPL